VAKVSGRITQFNVNDNDSIKKGEILAVMETTATISEIDILKKTIDTINSPETVDIKTLPVLSRLGELQASYSLFMKLSSDYASFLNADFYGNRIVSLRAEILATEAYMRNLKVKEKLFDDNLELELRNYRRDSLLFVSNVIPEIEIERSRQSVIRLSIELQQVRLDYDGMLIELEKKRQEMQDYAIRRDDEKAKLIAAVSEALLNLKADIAIWENSYILMSPFDGVVSFTRYWRENQVVARDEPVLYVVPYSTGDYIGRITLKMQRSGKVKTGQPVNIKLSGYPYLEYGMLRGVISAMSVTTSDEESFIEVYLPNGLTTLYGKSLDFNQNMSGIAEIVTEDLRLLQRILHPMKNLVTMNRR
jgi:HlyD family secretion protein